MYWYGYELTELSKLAALLETLKYLQYPGMHDGYELRLDEWIYDYNDPAWRRVDAELLRTDNHTKKLRSNNRDRTRRRRNR